jgi:hypothetical protein
MMEKGGKTFISTNAQYVTLHLETLAEVHQSKPVNPLEVSPLTGP